MTDHVRNDSIAVFENDEIDDQVQNEQPSMDDKHKSSTNDVQVFARFRPLNERESDLDENQRKKVYQYKNENDCTTIEVLRPPGSVTLTEKDFTFDYIFPEATTQEQLYNRTAKPLLDDLFQGFNCTMMAYGQTGSGKSYTMTGPAGTGDVEQEGIIPRMMRDLFSEIEARADQSTFVVQTSYVQIYLEKVSDLLNPELDNLKLREVVSRKYNKSKKLKSVKSMVYIEGCTVCTVKSVKDMLKVMKRGDLNRVTAATDMNDYSSRSHSVFVVSLIQTDTEKQTRKTSKLFLVDLAGSEQVDRSGATGLVLEQAKKINKSLSALSLVIQSLVEKKPHIPYRDSKLTRLLTDSLGGNAKTVLLLALSPSYDSLAETYSTLGVGSRAKKMENKATINEEMTIGTYKKLVAVMGKDLDGWKRKYEESEKKYDELLIKYNDLEGKHTRLRNASDAKDEVDIHKWKVEMGLSPPPGLISHDPLINPDPVVDVKQVELEVTKEKEEDEEATEEVTTVEDVGTGVSNPVVSGISNPVLSLDDLCMFQTGNLIVFGADKMFTFESF